MSLWFATLALSQMAIKPAEVAPVQKKTKEGKIEFACPSRYELRTSPSGEKRCFHLPTDTSEECQVLLPSAASDDEKADLHRRVVSDFYDQYQAGLGDRYLRLANDESKLVRFYEKRSKRARAKWYDTCY